jgi:class 3 adenylate cyclase
MAARASLTHGDAQLCEGARMPALPTGTVTFLFSDMEGSTALLQDLGDRYTDVLADHRQLLRAAFQTAGGHEVDTAGDGFFVKPGFSRIQAWRAPLCRRCWQAVENNTGRRNAATLCNQKGYALASVLVRMIVMALG